MGYGPPKYSNKEILGLILEGIRGELQKNGDFSGDSLSFYGFECEFSVKVNLTARGESKVLAEAVTTGGEPTPREEEDGNEPEPIKQAVAASGKIKKGK